jgi:hypothetical protein
MEILCLTCKTCSSRAHLEQWTDTQLHLYKHSIQPQYTGHNPRRADGQTQLLAEDPEIVGLEHLFKKITSTVREDYKRIKLAPKLKQQEDLGK